MLVSKLGRINRDWRECRRCPLGASACNHVLYEVPAGRSRVDVLFIGEAPGMSEDATGRPFIGRAGKLLRRTIEAAEPVGVTVGFANLLACRPTGPDGKDRPPAPNEVNACQGRLIALIEVLQPLLIIGLGRVPEAYLPGILRKTYWFGTVYYLYHPSYISRRGGFGCPEWEKWFIKFVVLFGGVKAWHALRDRDRRVSDSGNSTGTE